jgi:hypothetical protein
MQVYMLQTGEEVVLEGNVRLTVLAVEGDTVWLGITAPAGDGVVVIGFPERPTLREPVQVASPSLN